MKDLSKTLNEQLVTEARRPVLYEIQGDDSKGAAYSTFEIETAKKKYKHGFLTYSRYEECVFATVFNTVEDLQELLDTDDDNYTALLDMKPQESKLVNGELYVCLW